MTVTLLHQPQTQPNEDMFGDFKVSPLLREFIVVDYRFFGDLLRSG